MKDKISKKRLLTLITAILLFTSAITCIFFRTGNETSRINVKEGVLDLNFWDTGRDGVLNLNGQWKFYWNKFLKYQDIMSAALKADVTAEVPEVWNSYKINGKSLSGFGFGTYVLKVTNAPVGKELSLHIPTFSTAYELDIDDKSLASNGRVGTSSKDHLPLYQPMTVSFTAYTANFYIIVRVSNFTYARGGMWYAINMGTPEQIKKMDKATTDKDVFLFGALSVMAVYYMSLFLLRREDKSSMYFVFMCVIFASRTVIYGDYMIYRLIPFISYRAIIETAYLTLCWFPIFAAFMIGELFPEETSKKVLKAALVYAVFITLLLLFTPISFFTRWIYIVQVGSILTGAYPVFILCIAFLKGKKDSMTILLGALAVIICAMRDMLYQNNIIQSSIGELVSFGLFILLLLQSFVLSRRFSEAFKNVNALSLKLLELDKMKDEFLANTSHELRTPLSGILGITEAMLEGSGGQLNEQQKKDLAIISGSSRRLANLVNDILDYSKLKNGDILLDIRPVHIEALIHTVVNVLRQINITKQIEILYQIPEILPSVMADENRVAQILYNLIGNAVKFTVRGYIKITVIKKGSKMEICIGDTGEGIPQDKLEDIFKFFEQVDTSLTRRHGGTGLGLPITKQLVEHMGGTIWVESEQGVGSQFYFTLPTAGDVNEQLAMSTDESNFNIHSQEIAASLDELTFNTNIPEGNSRVLLVDDDAVNLQAAASLLRLKGYGVTIFGSGNAALEELKKSSDYSLVILDVMMPEISGYEVCKKIRNSYTAFELPVLMLTARTATEDIVMGFEAGANDYLPKPYEPAELLARVRTLTGLKTSVDMAMAAETAFLQAQIKPHFLFNTLNAISSFCDSNPEQAQRLIDDFSNYLRHCFDFKNLESFGLLENELSLVKSYIEIQKVRFGDKLLVEFDIENDLNFRVPLFTIQPLVENAIIHGLRKKGGGGIVTISVKRIQEDVWIAVKDDGQGIENAMLEKILSKEAGRGIGLWNIDRRLKKLYGQGIKIDSVLGLGTEVSYCIPVGGNKK